jgi:hypothetical protein
VSLTDTDPLSAPEILAQEVVDDFEAALEQFGKIAPRPAESDNKPSEKA